MSSCVGSISCLEILKDQDKHINEMLSFCQSFVTLIERKRKWSKSYQYVLVSEEFAVKEKIGSSGLASRAMSHAQC